MNKDLLKNIEKLHRKFQTAIYKIISRITGKPFQLGYGVTNNSDVSYTKKDIEEAFKSINQKTQERNVDNIIPYPCIDVKKDT